MAQLLEGSIIRKQTGDEIIATLIDISNMVKTPVPENAKFIALGETSATAYRGDRGKIAYDHSQVAHAPSNAQKNSDITKAEIEAKLTGAITTHTHTFATLISRPTTLKGYGLTEIETSLRATTSGLIVLGVDAALNLTGDGGQGSTVFGYKAAESAVESEWFTAIGRNAGQFNVSGLRWSAFGQNAGQNNISGNDWLAFGANAGRYNTIGDAWTAIGNNAGYSNTTGRVWTAIGAQTGYSNTTGDAWTSIGAHAGYSNTTGRAWTAIGNQAGQYNTTGRSWTAIGFDAGKENLTGNAWTAIGSNAGMHALGSFWTAIGIQAGMYNTVDESVSIGFKTAENLADGTSQATSFANSVHIGSRAKVSADGVTNEIAIGYNVIGKGSNTVVIGNDDITKTYLKGEVHASIAASMITESTTKRFVTDTEKSTWNATSNLAFGTTAGTVAQGNDSRIINGQTAYSWGNHASIGYALNSALNNYLLRSGGSMTGTISYSGSENNPMFERVGPYSYNAYAIGKFSATGGNKGLGLSSASTGLQLKFGNWNTVATMDSTWDTILHTGNLKLGVINLITGTSKEYKNITVPGPSASSSVSLDGAKANIEEPGTYMVSIRIKGVSGTGFGVRLVLHRGTESTISGNRNTSPLIYEDGIIEQEIQSNPNFGWIYISLSSDTTALPVQYAMLKAEKGNLPTDWAPAPEDKADANKFQVVEELPAIPTEGVFYFVKE